jgi:hypothetical protein
VNVNFADAAGEPVRPTDSVVEIAEKSVKITERADSSVETGARRLKVQWTSLTCVSSALKTGWKPALLD